MKRKKEKNINKQPYLKFKIVDNANSNYANSSSIFDPFQSEYESKSAIKIFQYVWLEED